MNSQFRWIGPDSDHANYLLGFTPLDGSLRGESLNLNLKLKAHPLKVPELRREHKAFGFPMHDYKPLDEQAKVYSAPFEVHGGENRLTIPAAILAGAYGYKGQSLTLGAELEVDHQGKVLARLPVEQAWMGFERPQPDSLPREAPRPALTSQAEGASLRPSDAMNLPSMIASLSAEQRQKVLLQLGGYAASLLIAAWLLVLRFQWSLAEHDMSSKKDYIGGSLMMYLFLGLYFMPRLYRRLSQEMFGQYLDINLKQRQTIGLQSDIRLGELFEASAEFPLDQLRLRLVAVQQERYLYRIRVPANNRSSSYRGNAAERAAAGYIGNIHQQDTLLSGDLVRTTPADHGATLYDYQYSTASAHLVIFDQVLPGLAAGEPIQAQCNERLQLADFFAQMRPPVMLNPHCGLSLEWRLQLLHPKLKDVEVVLGQLSFDPASFSRS